MDHSPSAPWATTTPPPESRPIAINLIDLHDPTNGRLEPNPKATARLRDQIATDGLINPITVRTRGGRYELIAGRNRLEACRQLGWSTIPATIHDVDDYKTATMRLAENVTRSNLSPVEEALQLADLVEQNPHGIDGVAQTLGRKPNWILDRLEILAWDTPIQQAVHARKLSLAAASRLARIPDPTERQRYCEQAVIHGISARTANLWLQAAMTQTGGDIELSEKSVLQGTTQPTDKILQSCHLCGSPVEIAAITRIACCPSCATALLHAAANQHQPT